VAEISHLVSSRSHASDRLQTISIVSQLNVTSNPCTLTSFTDIPIVDAAIAKQVNATDVVRVPRFSARKGKLNAC